MQPLQHSFLLEINRNESQQSFEQWNIVSFSHYYKPSQVHASSAAVTKLSLLSKRSKGLSALLSLQAACQKSFMVSPPISTRSRLIFYLCRKQETVISSSANQQKVWFWIIRKIRNILFWDIWKEIHESTPVKCKIIGWHFGKYFSLSFWRLVRSSIPLCPLNMMSLRTANK